jgi:hypothetical protein
MTNRFVVTLGLAAVAAGAAAALPPRSGVLALPAQTQAAQPRGAISGVVIDGTTKRPVPGADVQLTGGEAGAAGRRTTTDAQGRFSVDGLPAGNQYAIRVSRVGYFDGYYGHFGQRTPGQLSRALIVLRENEVVADANVYMYRPASIGGTVVDRRAQPVSGAQVRVLTRATVAGASRLAGGRGTATDERGVYRITGLTAGDYILEAAAVPLAPDPGMGTVSVRDRAADHATAAARLRIVYPGSRSIQEAVPLRLDFGEDRAGVDFTVPAVEVRQIAGRLEGPPDAFGTVVIRLVPEGSEPGGARQDAAVTVADESGRFFFTNVPAGRYAVRAVPGVVDLGSSQEGIPNRSGSASSVTLDDGLSFRFVRFLRSEAIEPRTIGRPRDEPPGYWGDVTVDVDARDPRQTFDVAVTLQPPLRITGRAVGDGARYAPIMAQPVGEGQSGWAMTEIRAEGPFMLAGLPPGRYLLRSRTPDSLVKSVEWAGGDYTDTPLNLGHGRDVTDVVVTLTRNGARLTGSVVDAGGRPAMAASVVYFPANPDGWRDFGFTSPRFGRSFVSSSTGQFRTLPLPAGEYCVVAIELGLRAPWHDSRFFAAVAGQATRVKVDWGETRTLALRVQPSPVR